MQFAPTCAVALNQRIKIHNSVFKHSSGTDSQTHFFSSAFPSG